MHRSLPGGMDITVGDVVTVGSTLVVVVVVVGISVGGAGSIAVNEINLEQL